MPSSEVFCRFCHSVLLGEKNGLEEVLVKVKYFLEVLVKVKRKNNVKLLNIGKHKKKLNLTTGK